VRLWPSSSLDNAQIVEFISQPNQLEGTLLWRSLFEIKVKIMAKDGITAIQPTDTEKRVNIDSNTMNTLIKDVQLYFNDIQVDTSNNMYSYSTDIDQKLTYSKEYFESQGQMYGAEMPDVDPDGFIDQAAEPSTNVRKIDRNEHVKLRSAKFANSKEVTYLGPWANLFTSQKKMMIPGVGIKVRVILQDKNNVLCCKKGESQNFQFKITSFCLILKKVRLNAKALLSIETMLRKEPIRYQVQKTLTTYQTISAKVQQQTFDSIFQGVCPTLVICTFLTEDAFRGHERYSKYNYQDFKLESLKISLDSEEEVKQPIVVDIANKYYHEGYQSLLEATNIFRRNTSLAITPETYMKGLVGCWFLSNYYYYYYYYCDKN
jgi:hypothetical protein